MNLKIEIPFDDQTFISQSMIKWTLTNNKPKSSIKSILIWGTALFILGILIGIEKDEYINVLSILGVISIIYGIWWLVVLIKGKRKYKQELNEFAKQYKIKNVKCDYEFTDEYIRYTDKQTDLKLNWDLFQSYSILHNNILINLNESVSSSYILGEEELGRENYLNLTRFLSDELKLKLKEM